MATITSKETPPIFTQLENLITNSGEPHNTPADILAYLGSASTSIAILDNGNISSHIISTVNHDTDTLFQSCSISKAVTGLGIARLMDKGLFSPSSTACSLLPEHIVKSLTSDPRTVALTRTITVKHLMSHTAGLSVGGYSGYPVDFHPQDNLPNTAKILTGGEGVNSWKVKVIAPPGLAFMYSGGGMVVLQAIVEHVTGKLFRNVIREEVFEPLGMTRSFYVLDEAERNVSEAWYNGYTKCETRWHQLPEAAAAGVWTTPADLMRMMRAMQGSIRENDDGKEERFISKDMAKQVLTSGKGSVGLCWFCDDISMGHSGGNLPGYKTHFYGYADLHWNKKKKGEKDTSALEDVQAPQNCGIAVMSTAMTGYQVAWKVMHALTYLKGWPAGGPRTSNLDPGAPLAVDGDAEAGASEQWKDWIGVWSDKDGNYTWKIAEDKDGKPVAGIEHVEPEGMMKLRTAAISPNKYTGGRKSIDLLLGGTEILLRLGWEVDKDKKETKVVEMCHYEIQTKVVLYKENL